MSLARDGEPGTFPTELDGRSLYGHIIGDGGHDEVLGEYYAEGTTTPLFMVRRGTEKFIIGEGDPPQMFDVASDPEELVNLAGVRNEDVAGVESELASTFDVSGLTEQVLLSQHRRAFVSKVMRTQGIDWDYTPTFDGADLYIRNTKPIGQLEDESRFPGRNP